MFIIFDTNIWFSQLGLNSQSGAAVRFFVQQCGATVAIPEVVRLELERDLTNHLQKLKNGIEKNHRELLAVFGTLKEISLPSDEEIRDKVSDLLTNIDVPHINIPFSLEAAKSSLIKTIEKLPPSNNTQQFKDGVIWANCLELLKDNDVCLVSEDKDFYENRDYKEGLASNLCRESEKYPHKFRIMPDLDQLLKEIRKKVKIDNDSIWEGVFDEERERIQEILTRPALYWENPPTSRLSYLQPKWQHNFMSNSKFHASARMRPIRGERTPPYTLEGTAHMTLKNRNFMEFVAQGKGFYTPTWKGNNKRSPLFSYGRIL